MSNLTHPHSSPSDFDGRVALVTGAGSGFGRAAALLFAEAGARLAVSDLDAASADATAQAARAAGAEAISARVDVRDAAAVQDFVKTTVARFGRIDCAFNNAGVLGPLAELHTLPVDAFDRVIDVNVRGVWHCLQAEIAQMLTQEPPSGGHAIVNTSSVAGLMGSPLLPAYSASKHAVVGLTTSAAKSYGRRGIRINCICPGPIETPLAGPLFDYPNMRKALLARQALDRFGTPEEVARLAVWLCSPAASLITGTPVRVDAGAMS
jgi:NAD(P)-dependent dehydrogenase (short-subunit alcohol dehydrogenase family)